MWQRLTLPPFCSVMIVVAAHLTRLIAGSPLAAANDSIRESSSALRVGPFVAACALSSGLIRTGPKIEGRSITPVHTPTLAPTTPQASRRSSRYATPHKTSVEEFILCASALNLVSLIFLRIPEPLL